MTVMVQSITASCGTFIAATSADFIGYHNAFVAAGVAIALFALVYAIVCGPGDSLPDLHLDKN